MKSRYHYVRILGMSMGKIIDESYYCTLWYDHQAITVKAEATEIWLEHWNRHPNPNTYHSYLFSCAVPLNLRDSGVYPANVSLSSQVCMNISTMLPVKKDGLDIGAGKTEFKKQFAVCVKGMDFTKDLSARLLEWIELLFLLGADKIFFYNFRVHKNMEKVLNYHERKGKVKVIPLSLPGDQPNDPDTRTFYLKRATWQKRRNEVVPYNDCLYSNLYLFEYVIPLDIDEVIMPVKTYTWKEMLQGYRKEKPEVFEKYSSFSAQNTYFLEVYNSSRAADIPSYYYMLQNRIRSANFSLFGHSVKSFVSTDLSKTIFNHYTLDPLYIFKKANHVMNTSHVQMNHYKERCPREIYSQCQSKYLVYKVIDNTIDKYKNELMRNVESVIKKLNLPIKDKR
ncbi:hypothetical protein SK128_020932 [Halocaridina rubra]|uniref:Glycosyltransferase family 92 protein n=1 Tax=Halocaridina rubra TaxID=373956 RepID=A0AAN8WRT2_HALRR